LDKHRIYSLLLKTRRQRLILLGGLAK